MVVEMTCCEVLYNRLRARLVQSRARAYYRLSRWKSSRVRRKWLKRELAFRKEMELCKRNTVAISPAMTAPDHGTLVEDKSDVYAPPSWVKECDRNKLESAKRWRRNSYQKIFESVVTYDEGVSVLSPQKLSERLSENALAREAVGESDLELAQYLKDERIALFLQNDEFITELRSNKEFMSALQREHDEESEMEEELDDSEINYLGRKLNSLRGEGSGVLPQLDDATFKERLSNMGKASRKKFAQIAKVFSRGKRGGGGSSRSLLPTVVGGGSASTNGKDLLMSSDPLIDDYDEERVHQSSVDPVLSSSPRINP